MKYYLDSAIIIYIVEDIQPYVTAIEVKLAASGLILVTSELARLECRVQPVRAAATVLLQEFDNYFVGPIAELLPLTHEVIDCATELRARYNFKTPDALHLAAAIVSQCDVFLTNDQRLSRCQEIIVETV
jgi:uncharacterized protein